jgi:hypothetical protein
LELIDGRSEQRRRKRLSITFGGGGVVVDIKQAKDELIEAAERNYVSIERLLTNVDRVFQDYGRCYQDAKHQPILADMKANALSTWLGEAKPVVKHPGGFDLTTADDLLNKFIAIVLSSFQRERNGRLKPWSREDISKRHASMFIVRRYHSDERDLMVGQLVEGEDIARVDFRSITTTTGRVIERAILATMVPHYMSERQWLGTLTPESVIQRAEAEERAEQEARARSSIGGRPSTEAEMEAFRR